MISERVFARSFDSFWRELLPLLTPRFVSLFNEAYEHRIVDSAGVEIDFFPVSGAVEHPDLVAEFAFRLACLAHRRDIFFEQAEQIQALAEDAEKEALGLIGRYEGKLPEALNGLSEIERIEGRQLACRYQHLYRLFPVGSKVEFCPRFPGAGFLDSCEGDLGIASCLIEVKTTIRKPSGRDLRQLLIYLALSANAGRNHWREFGLFNPRRGTLHRAEVEPLVLRISGGRPAVDVFSDLISFLESNDMIIEKRF